MIIKEKRCLHRSDSFSFRFHSLAPIIKTRSCVLSIAGFLPPPPRVRGRAVSDVLRELMSLYFQGRINVIDNMDGWLSLSGDDFSK